MVFIFSVRDAITIIVIVLIIRMAIIIIIRIINIRSSISIGIPSACFSHINKDSHHHQCLCPHHLHLEYHHRHHQYHVSQECRHYRHQNHQHQQKQPYLGKKGLKQDTTTSSCCLYLSC